MPDFTLEPCSTAIIGMTGSGKTTLALLHLLKTPAACRFIFDDMGQAAKRLGLPLVSGDINHRAGLEKALSTRWLCFNPHSYFPGDVQAGFEFFCDLAFQFSQRTRHKKMVFVDEAWRFQDRDKIPKEFATLSQMGRSENVELVTATQEPHRLNSSILGSATELVCFRLQESVELKKIQGLGADAAAVAQLNLGSFIAYNRIRPQNKFGKSTEFRGKLF